MKIYISGKIIGDPDYKRKFERAATAISSLGHTPINPALLPEGLSETDYMRLSFAEIDAADMVLFLDDWKESGGAALERTYCQYIWKPYGKYTRFLEKHGISIMEEG